MSTLGISPRAFRLAFLEPAKYRRKLSLVLPVAIIAVFSLWSMAVTVMYNSGEGVSGDPRSIITTLVQLGGFMLPLLVGSTVIILANADKDYRMLTRIQSFGVAPRELGFSKALWVMGVALIGLVAVTGTTLIAAATVGVSPIGNYVVIVLFAHTAAIVSLVAAYLNIAFRARGSAIILGSSLVGSIIGMSSGFIPSNVGVWIPFAFAGALSPARISKEGFLDVELSLLHPIAVLVTCILITGIAIATFPQRSSND